MTPDDKARWALSNGINTDAGSKLSPISAVALVISNIVGAGLKLWRIRNGYYLEVSASEDDLVAEDCSIDLAKK